MPPPISPSPRPYSNRFHRDTQESRLHSTTIPQPFLQPQPNHASTILRVESKNDSDSTIPHPIFSNHNSTTRKRIREAVAEGSSSGNPRRMRRIPSLGPSLPRLTAAAHQSPLQAKCNLIRGKLRRARSNAPQRFEASSWASCRTTADASSFCESRAVRHICRTSSTQMSRSRVTFVTLPATPRPVPSKKRQRFILCNFYRGGFTAPVSTPARKQPPRAFSTRFRGHSKG